MIEVAGSELSDAEKVACITYDAATRTMVFLAPDVNQGYRLKYLTDIVLSDNGTISNQVKLVGGSLDGVSTGKGYDVVYQGGWASLTKGGELIITKYDANKKLLPGAEFTLFTADESTPIRKVVSNENGIARMKAIPAVTISFVKQLRQKILQRTRQVTR